MNACVGDLADGLDLAKSTVSHHLKELRRNGLIEMRRQGRKVECSINAPALNELSSLIQIARQDTIGGEAALCATPKRSETRRETK